MLDTNRTEAFNKGVIADKNAQVGQVSAGCRVDERGQKVTERKDKTHYIAFDFSDMTGGASADILENLTDKIDGVISFNGNTLKGKNFSIGQIAFRCSRLPGGALLNGSASWDEEAPAQLKNTQVTITQNDREIWCGEINDFHNPAEQGNTDEWYRAIGNNPVILANIPFEVHVKSPKGSTMPSDVLGKFYFRGVESKAQNA